MSDRAMQGVKPPPSTRRELERMVRELKRAPQMKPEDLDAFNDQVAQVFPHGFDRRDEANAIIALSVRNGPLENLHAGKHSPLLEDDSLSRLTDSEIKAVMLYATEMLTFMLYLRDEAPEAYRRYVQAYGSRYCRAWERGKD